MPFDYHDDLKKKNTKKLRKKLSELPPFLEEFFMDLSDKTSSRTRVGYAYDLKRFFTFLTENIDKFMNISILEFTLDDFRRIESMDIRKYLEYLTYYTREFSTVTNKEIELEAQNEAEGKSRKLSSVRTLFSYFYKMEKIKSNPAELVDFPKLTKKSIVYLEVDEIAKLLDEVEDGGQLTGRQKKFHEHTKSRDLALITLLLGTGMRISECVGIDLKHIDFNKNAIKITRKGGDEDIIFFGEEVSVALIAYLIDRKKKVPKDGNEDALFLSLQNKRLSDRAIQILVKKYSKVVTPLKKITPHKLRSTYGTSLYQETGDIYLVAEILGHKDVNTTKKHYAHMPLERRRAVANVVKLRED